MEAAIGPTAGQYIGHHLTHWQNKPMSGVIDFSVYNLDSILWAVVLGIVGSFFLWKAARTATSGVPGRFQAICGTPDGGAHENAERSGPSSVPQGVCPCLH